MSIGVAGGLVEIEAPTFHVESEVADTVVQEEEPKDDYCIRWGKLCHGYCPCLNDPNNLDCDIVHQFDNTNYKLYGLPVPQLNQVLGLVGPLVIGKTAVLEILTRKVRPNLGRVNNPPTWKQLLTYFEKSNYPLYKYFSWILQDQVKVCTKLESLLCMRRGIRGIVGDLLQQKDERGVKAEICSDLGLNKIIGRNPATLSSGEFQRFAIGLTAVQNAQVYMFDEPSAHLDVKQRIKAAQVIRSLSRLNSYVMVADKDLSVLGYLADFICCLYGIPGRFGVVSLPFSVREGINMFLNQFVQTGNIRSCEDSLTSEVTRVSKGNAEELKPVARYRYPSMTINRGSFKLQVKEGYFSDDQIIVVLGENGTGKTTFIRRLAGLLKHGVVGGSCAKMPKFSVSYKPQNVRVYFSCTVREMLNHEIHDARHDPQFISYVMEPLQILHMMSFRVIELCQVQMQRILLCLCLGKPADIYLIDEPSAFMHVDQIIVAAKVIKNFIRHTKKTAFVVDHDMMLATYLADRVIVFEGKPSIDCTANSPHSLLTGMNLFLSHLDVSGRQDPITFQPVINKPNSACDKEQKSAGHYYLND